MIVCHCNGVTDREIREAARAGARSRHHVARHCEAGRDCGGCRAEIERIVRDAASEAEGVPNPSDPDLLPAF